MKRLLLIAGFNLLALIAVLYLFELILKFKYSKYPCTDFTPHYERCSPPGQALYTWGHLVRNNIYGFRERNFSTPKPPGVFRIMVLGDSLTWGAGLAETERYTNLLEKMLNDYLNQREISKKIEVLNFGLPAAPTTEERDVLKKYKNIVQPDLIIVGFCLNDLQPKSQDWTPEKEKVDKIVLRLRPMAANIAYRIGLYRTTLFIHNSIYKLLGGVGFIPPWYVGLDRVYQKDSREWKDFEDALKDIKNMSDQMGLPSPIFAVLNQGVYLDKPTDYNNPDDMLKLYLKWYHQAEDGAKKIGFRTLNYEKEIANELSDRPLAVNKFDGHPSAELNKLYARKLFEVIIYDYIRYITGGFSK